MMQGIKGALQPMPDGAQQLEMNGLDWSNNEQHILYVAVEYVKDDFKLPSSDMNAVQHAQVYFDNQHMNMLDPNMGSVARYSPMYTETTSKFCNPAQGPVVVRQLVQSNAVEDAIVEQPPDLSPNDFLQMVDSSQSVVQNLQMEQTEQDILITDQATGISYLVERCLNDSQLMDPEALLDSDLLSLDDNALKSQLSEIIVEPNLVEDESLKAAEAVEIEAERRSLRNLAGQDEEIVPCVQQICDRPIQTRARASLPVSHLVINKNQRGDDISVFAKKFIPSRTQFGPIEGVLTMENIKCEHESVHLSIDTSGILQRLDVSNENLSNWMCFVQLAPKLSQQNLILFQQDNNLYFITTKNIHPKQELLVGYSVSYAQRRSLSVLEHEIDEDDLWPCYECPLKFINSEELQKHLETHDDDNDIQVSSNCNSNKGKKKSHMDNLICSMCNLECSSQLDLGNHFVYQHSYQSDICDETVKAEEPQATEPVAIKRKEEYKCPKCYKYFATGDRIQRHMMVHGDDATKPFQCDKCHKRFLNNSALSCHLKTHLFGVKVYECPICKESFQHILQLKSHVSKHSVDGKFTCPYCKKVFVKYSIIRKHIRAFHCDKIHTCSDCDKAFPTLDKLRMHLLKHSDHREFLCADCGKQFKRKDKLREHCKKMHNEESELENVANSARKLMPKSEPTDYHRFIYKCHSCLLGFKRRGMLVNHLAKRHPDISPDTVPELNLPIYRTTKDYYCNYCDKIYKSSSKRKAHILKNHPGLALPLGHRGVDVTAKNSDLPNPTYSQTVGSITTHPQACCWCHRQYASKAKLLQHQRKKHADLMDQEKMILTNHQDNKNGCISSDEVNLLDEVCNVGVSDDSYYQLISLANGSNSIEQNGDVDIANDERLYRLVNVENGLVPPR